MLWQLFVFVLLTCSVCIVVDNDDACFVLYVFETIGSYECVFLI